MDDDARPVSPAAYWTGWVLSILPCLMFIGGGIFALTQGDKMADDIRKMGWEPRYMTLLTYVEIACAIIYLIPQTAVLGAILLTGYLGGAVATHARLGDPLLVVPVIFGILIWLGIFLRDRRLRALVPLRK
jgi:Mn2+/Fe2+ NRAMP family transporter